MSNDIVNANSGDVRKLAAALATYKQEVSAASKKVRSALGSANWHDNRKSQFEARLKDLQQGVDRFMSGEVDQMIKALNELARRLDEIRSIRM
jgi:DNA repair ATPase RecN